MKEEESRWGAVLSPPHALGAANILAAYPVEVSESFGITQDDLRTPLTPSELPKEEDVARWDTERFNLQLALKGGGYSESQGR